MNRDKLVWVEYKYIHFPLVGGIYESTVRILKGKPTECCRLFKRMPYGEAVADIRKQLWNRSAGHCELCTSDVTEQSGEMHEMKHRGRGGEISLDNSVFACPQCHKYQHKERNPQWSTKPAS